MLKPTRVEVFNALYAAASAHGRESILFGDSREGARSFFEKSLVTGDAFPSVYLEFPLTGEPCLDLLAIYSRVEPNAAFVPGAGYGYDDVFGWFAKQDARDAAIGLELDLSRHVTNEAGIYLQQRESLQLALPFLEVLGEGVRGEAFASMAGRMPRGWPPAYLGLFPGRPGTPLRIGGYLSEPSRKRCSQDPSFLGTRFDLMGFTAYDEHMLRCCSALMGKVPVVDFQFDLTGRGRVGDTFGLSLAFGKARKQDAATCMRSGYGADVMRTLEQWGLADDRWRLLADSTFARRVPYAQADGSEGHLALAVRLNFAKVKFVQAQPQRAKFYLVLTAADICP